MQVGNNEMNESNSPAKGRAPGARSQTGRALPKEVQSHLGRKLQAVYGEMVQEPVPDKFMNLLSQLSQAETSPDDPSQLTESRGIDGLAVDDNEADQEPRS